MNLYDRLARELDDAQSHRGTHLDVDRLCRVARTQGTRALRRRRAGTVVGGLAAVAVIGLAMGAADGGSAPEGYADSVATDVATPGFPPVSSFDPAHPGPVGPATAPGVAAALRWAVTDVQDGSATAYRGQQGHEWYSDLQWTPTDGLGLSVIGINVQTDMRSSHCTPTLLHCQERTLQDGSQLTTYDEERVVADGTGIRRTADLIRPDGVRVSVSATNGFDLAGNGWRITRPEPPLSADQLATIVEQPFWGRTLPAYFLSQGRDLSPYEDIDSGFAPPPRALDHPAGG